MFTMKSKYRSRCRYCGAMIGEGDMIAKGEVGWGHVKCVRDDVIEPLDKPVTVAEMQATKAFNASVESVSPVAIIPAVDPFNPVDESEPVKPREFVPSHYQQAIFDAGANGSGNIVVNATAGSGKTRTIQEFIKRYIPADKTWIYLVFNKKNQLEAAEKIDAGDNGLIATFHSFCLNYAIRSAFGKVKIDDRKVYQLLAVLDPMKSDRELWPIVAKVVGLVKNTLTDVNDYDVLMAMCDHYGVELNGSGAQVLQMVRDIIGMCKTQTSIIDFDDMLWLTVDQHLPLPQYDYVLVDETQDLNAVQIEIVLRIRKPDGRTMAVGDFFQAIYGFRGADADAMQRVIDALQAKVLPLSLTYRNPKSIVALVNQTLPEIKHECLSDASDGEVLNIQQDKLYDYVQPGDMVICRTNAPLVKPAFDLIRRGIKAVIMGRSIGEELVNLINRVSKRVLTDNLEFVLANLAEYKSSEVMRLMAQGKETTAQALEDKVDTIFALAENCKLLPELIAKAETIFSDDAKGVVFSSAHRAKGLEADNVFILKYKLMPHPMAKQGWQLKQEANIKFVALTRSRQRLYFVQE